MNQSATPENSCFLFDAHNHAHDERLEPRQETLVARAVEQGVRRMVVNGTCEADWEAVWLLHLRFPQVIIPSFGVHPWKVMEASNDWLATLEKYLDRGSSVIGEIGLDRWKEPRDEPLQERLFVEQLRLAVKRDLPVTIHCLRAWGWLMKLLRKEKALPRGGFLLHSYGGSVDLIRPLAAMGAYFSFSGTVALERKTRQQEALRHVPQERLLVETDCPDMLPPETLNPVFFENESEPLNVPQNLPKILKAVAIIRGLSTEQMALIAWKNSCRCFHTCT